MSFQVGASVDELVPTLSLEASSGVAFKLKGLVLEGGVWNTDGVEPTTEMATKLGKVNFSWVKAGSLEMDGGIEVPIYLNEGRQILPLRSQPVDTMHAPRFHLPRNGGCVSA